MMLFGQKGMGPAGRGHEHDTPGALLEDASGGPPELEAATWGGGWGIRFIRILRSPTTIANDVATITVDGHGQHGILEALAVEIKKQQRIGKGMAQAIFV